MAGLLSKIGGWLGDDTNRLKLAGASHIFGALDQGQAPNVAPFLGAIQEQKDTQAFRDSLGSEDMMGRFSPEERSFLAGLPPQVAQKLIGERVFAQPEPTTYGWQTMPDGTLVRTDSTGGFTPMGAFGKPEAPDQTSAMQNYQYMISQGMDPTEAMERAFSGGGVTVNNRTDPAPATGWRNVYDDDGRLVSQEPIPGGPADMEGQQAQAKQQAEAVKELSRSQQMLATIDSVISDPALDSATGWMQYAQKLPGSGAKRFSTKAAQLQGQVFLEGYQMLKGGGAITDYEGSKAESAMARLDTAQSADDYREALRELREVVEAGMKRLQGEGSDGSDLLRKYGLE